MKCGECRCFTGASGADCLLYHCGRRELKDVRSQCECAHLDRLGNVLKIDERCIIIPYGQPGTSDLSVGQQWLMQLKDVHLDGFRYNIGDVAEVRGKEAWRSEVPDSRVWELVGISDIISVRAFRKISSLANYFLTCTLAKLLALRRRQLVAGYLHWSEIKRLSRVNANTNRIVILEACNNVALVRAVLVECRAGRRSQTL